MTTQVGHSCSAAAQPPGHPSRAVVAAPTAASTTHAKQRNRHDELACAVLTSAHNVDLPVHSWHAPGEFSGYGPQQDGGRRQVPSQSNAQADIHAVFQHMLQQHGLEPQDILLYGQSVGSGPTVGAAPLGRGWTQGSVLAATPGTRKGCCAACRRLQAEWQPPRLSQCASRPHSHHAMHMLAQVWLAARTPGLAGVVLHSPLLSGLRVLYPGLRSWPSWLDVFPNQQLLPQVDALVMVLHGTRDEVIHISSGQALAALAQRPGQHLWAEGWVIGIGLHVHCCGVAPAATRCPGVMQHGRGALGHGTRLLPAPPPSIPAPYTPSHTPYKRTACSL